MFDNPNKELQRLQDRLLAAETPEAPALQEREPLDRQYTTPPAEPKKTKASKRSRIAGLLVLFVLISIVCALLLIWWWLWT